MTYQELSDQIAGLNDLDKRRQVTVLLPDGETMEHAHRLEVVREDVRLNPVVLITTDKDSQK